MCPFDAGLIEDNTELFISGYMKPVYDEDCSPNNGIPVYNVGPINEWWLQGYDGGTKLPIGVSTAFAEYFLISPSTEYEPIYCQVKEKVEFVKHVIEFLLENVFYEPSYEDLIENLHNTRKFPHLEEVVWKHAAFLCSQVSSLDENRTEDEKLMNLPCMQYLKDITNVGTEELAAHLKKITFNIRNNEQQTTKFVKATTTELVRDCFEHFFPEQIQESSTIQWKKGRCGVCEACQSPDCGECVNCKNMIKFGGTGKAKRACKQRKCTNMVNYEEENTEKEVSRRKERSHRKEIDKTVIHNDVKLLKKNKVTYNNLECYSSALVSNFQVNAGDFVKLKSVIAKIIYIYRKEIDLFHGQIFVEGKDTILSETADDFELFSTEHCEDIPLGCVISKVDADYNETPINWHLLGGITKLPKRLNYFYSKTYDGSNCRFEEYKLTNENVCHLCKKQQDKKLLTTPVLNDGVITWRNEEYRKGTGVFLKPTTYKFKITKHLQETKSDESVDENLYPEFYRKKSDLVKGSNTDTPSPFVVALIEDILTNNSKLSIRVRVFYRLENTTKFFTSFHKDLNYLYWTEEVVATLFENVVGKCYISFEDNLENPFEWSKMGPFRFYFAESYNPHTFSYSDVPKQAQNIGFLRKKQTVGNITPPNWLQTDRKLKCMDVFAGCGGLSEGLHQSGVAETLWAIEKEPEAAQAFRNNFPNCKVFTDDCNHLLKLIIGGQATRKGLPSKGEVDLLVGGPPCQGFSAMNRFNAGQYSLFKNSLVVTYLSYCEYYRPKYFILENVRNFAAFKRSIVLKLTLKCLLAMGYQATFGILQAGHYGVPQTRKRLILMAAQPGCVLPKFPEPLHVFSRRESNLSMIIDGLRYHNGTESTESAPYRTICVRDALSDLPDITNGWNRPEMQYDREAMTHYQKLMRESGNDDVVYDHICKMMAPLVVGRITQIPLYPGADWRDLPNISIRLNDGTMTNVLRYPYKLKKQKKGEPNRGVCQCAIGKKCQTADRQLNTLIPWCLPHTADRHNNWAAVYGRLEWDGFFGTTITNPEPMGKQGRVLHPEQHRVVSVRECARSQGFPDRFKFVGDVTDKYRQVGNAVPPPMGLQIGRELQKALIETELNY